MALDAKYDEDKQKEREQAGHSDRLSDADLNAFDKDYQDYKIAEMERSLGQEHDASDYDAGSGNKSSVADLKKSEAAAGEGTTAEGKGKIGSAAGAAADLAGSTTPLGAAKWAGKLLGSRKKKAAAGGGFLAIIIGLGIFAFTIIQGPLQFIHAAQLLQQFHFGRQDSFSNYRSSRQMMYALAGKSAQGRLGKTANKYADKWETRLNEDSGLRSVYSAGTKRFIGFEVIDENKAGRFLQDMDREGVPRVSSMTGSDINGNTFVGKNGDFVDASKFSNRIKRATIRSAVKGIGVNNMSSSLGTRLLKKRGGVLFHPMAYAAKKASDSYDAYKKKQLETKQASLDNGSGGVENPLRAKMKEIAGKIQSFLDKAKGPAAVIGAVCAVKSFNDSVDAQNLMNQQSLMRIGMDVITTGSQVQYGRDSFSAEQLGVYNDLFYDEKTKTSFFDDPGIQQESGQSPTGKDYAGDVKPTSSGLPGIVQLVANLPTGIPNTPIDVCGVLDKIGSLPGISQLFALVSAGTDKILTTFGLPDQDTMMKTLIGFFTSGGVDTLAQGALRGGEANIGARLAANNQFIAMGGRELSADEGAQAKQVAYQDQTETFSQSSVFAKYFNIDDSRSVAGTLFDRSPKNAGQMVASLTRLPATFSSMAMTIAGGATAKAAVPAYDYGFPLYGFSQDEQNNPAYEDPYANETYMLEGDRLERMNAEYGSDCFDMTVAVDGTLEYGESKDFHKIPDKCKDTGNEELTRYRFYLADIVTALGLACYEDDEDACSQLNGSSGQTGAAPAVPTDGQIVTGDTTNIPCQAGKDLGPAQGYKDGKLVNIRICDVQNIVVNSQLSSKVDQLLNAAKQAGVPMSGGGFRTMEEQIAVRKANCPAGVDIMNAPSDACSPPTAQPGYSNHQMGFAIDFTSGGSTISSGSKEFNWLKANAATYGLKNFPAEAFHWSVDGT